MKANFNMYKILFLYVFSYGVMTLMRFITINFFSFWLMRFYKEGCDLFLFSLVMFYENFIFSFLLILISMVFFYMSLWGFIHWFHFYIFMLKEGDSFV